MLVVVVVVVVVVVIGEAMQFSVRENPGRYDNLDYDNDNDTTKPCVTRALIQVSCMTP